MKTGIFAFFFSSSIVALAIAATLGVNFESASRKEDKLVNADKKSKVETKSGHSLQAKVVDSLFASGTSAEPTIEDYILDTILTSREVSLMVGDVSASVDLQEPNMEEKDELKIDSSGYLDLDLDLVTIEIDTTELPE